MGTRPVSQRPLDRLIQALEHDKALFFDEEQIIIPHKGWAIRYVGTECFQAIIFSDLTIYCSNAACPTIPDEDEKDLRTIAHSVGYVLVIERDKISFERPL